MTDAYIFDATRTPRGKGKKNGTLHEVTALQLATQQLEAIRERNNLDTSYVDDVILGCVSPVASRAPISPAPPRSTPTTPRPPRASRSTGSALPALKR